MTDNFKLFAGEASTALAKAICSQLGCQHGNAIITHFSESFLYVLKKVYVEKKCF